MAALVEDYLAAREETFLVQLMEWLRVPSISTDSEHAGDVRAAADWLVTHLRDLGLSANLVETAGHPAVLGELLQAGPDAPTVLIYGHYDVQPAALAEGWSREPFDPWVVNDRLYGRGTTDDKGQVFMHVKALEALLELEGQLPVNVRLLIEGEEEIGSPSFARLFEEHADRLAADVVLISDSPFLEMGVPAIYGSTRGLVGLEVEVTGPPTDLHSGVFGGAVLNPANVLARMLAHLHDDDGRISVPDLYGRVIEGELTAEGSGLRATEAGQLWDWLVTAAGGAVGGETNTTVQERLWHRPALDVHGIEAGYTGAGFKAIVPRSARATLSCRLTANQDPDEIGRAIGNHLLTTAPEGVTVHVRTLSQCSPWRADMSHAAYSKVAAALQAAFGAAPIVAGGGGSIGVLPILQQQLAAPIVLAGFGSPGENAHGPDEWLSLDHFRRGIQSLVEILRSLATVDVQRSF